MTKRRRRAEWLVAKTAKKAAARLLSELLLTRDDKLERFRVARATGPSRPELERLREVQAILATLGDAIQRGDSSAWSRIQRAFELLVPEDGPASDPGAPQSEPPLDRPSAAAVSKPGESVPSARGESADDRPKPALANPHLAALCFSHPAFLPHDCPRCRRPFPRRRRRLPWRHLPRRPVWPGGRRSAPT